MVIYLIESATTKQLGGNREGLNASFGMSMRSGSFQVFLTLSLFWTVVLWRSIFLNYKIVPGDIQWNES